MSILHTVNKTGQPLALCLRAVSSGDSVLLIEDGVYALMSADQSLSMLPDRCAVFVMDTDAMARGVPASVEAIDYDRFVTLCTEHDQVLSWF